MSSGNRWLGRERFRTDGIEWPKRSLEIERKRGILIRPARQRKKKELYLIWIRYVRQNQNVKRMVCGSVIESTCDLRNRKRASRLRKFQLAPLYFKWYLWLRRFCLLVAFWLVVALAARGLFQNEHPLSSPRNAGGYGGESHLFAT